MHLVPDDTKKVIRFNSKTNALLLAPINNPLVHIIFEGPTRLPMWCG